MAGIGNQFFWKLWDHWERGILQRTDRGVVRGVKKVAVFPSEKGGKEHIDNGFSKIHHLRFHDFGFQNMPDSFMGSWF